MLMQTYLGRWRNAFNKNFNKKDKENKIHNHEWPGLSNFIVDDGLVSYLNS